MVCWLPPRKISFLMTRFYDADALHKPAQQSTEDIRVTLTCKKLCSQCISGVRSLRNKSIVQTGQTDSQAYLGDSHLGPF